ncbi:hypothetical protein Q1695_001045 [Nippostrongylus brasiliensis]|nr:hypothetical protein Q1695_001045 [Nippostrongylus brasiliensis]
MYDVIQVWIPRSVEVVVSHFRPTDWRECVCVWKRRRWHARSLAHVHSLLWWCLNCYSAPIITDRRGTHRDGWTARDLSQVNTGRHHHRHQQTVTTKKVESAYTRILHERLSLNLGTLNNMVQ